MGAHRKEVKVTRRYYTYFFAREASARRQHKQVTQQIPDRTKTNNVMMEKIVMGHVQDAGRLAVPELVRRFFLFADDDPLAACFFVENRS